MRALHREPLVGLAAQLAMLVVLSATVGLSTAAWVVGVVHGLVATAFVWNGMDRVGASVLGPADRVTLARTVLGGGFATLVVEGFLRPPELAIMVPLAAVALLLDGVDGWVARHTGTTSALGARFDMEADSFLVLLLSVHVARELGLWVLLLGAARYLFGAAGWLVPWMGATLPFRYWRKVVTATESVVLILVMADVLPRDAAQAALAFAVLLLAESFGRDVWWLRRRRAEA